MGIIPLVIVCACYLWVSVDLFIGRNYPMALIFLCYAIANFALLWKCYLEN